ncbi:MAG: hypothetical protein JWP04_2399 [Belnapia sp.]|nr:hypothetical protein [Belnapia sp.]
MRAILRLLPLLLLAACFGEGAEGIAPPPPGALEQAGLSGPHTAIAAPAGTRPAPDIVTRPYPVPAAQLFAAITAVAATEPRSFPLDRHPERLEAAYVVRSRVIGFPDVVLLRVTAAGDAASTLVLHSSSRYGHYDFGVNKARLAHWLARLDVVLPPP